MIDYAKPALGYLVRAASSNLDSPLDAGGRARAEEAARFLSYERLGSVVSSHQPAAVDTAGIIFAAFGDRYDAIVIDERLGQNIDGWLTGEAPCVLVCGPLELKAAVETLTANVCADEIVAPGGIVSVH